MTLRVFMIILLSATMLAQEPSPFGPPPNKEAPAPGVSFERLRQAGELLEWAEVFGASYGTPKAQVMDLIEAGTDVLFDIDWQGARSLKRRLYFSAPAASLISSSQSCGSEDRIRRSHMTRATPAGWSPSSRSSSVRRRFRCQRSE